MGIRSWSWFDRGGRRRGSARQIYLLASGVCIIGFLIFVLRPQGQAKTDSKPHLLSAAPSLELLEATKAAGVSFKDELIRSIQTTGRVTVTLHVGLTDGEGKPSRFTDGNDPQSNLCWGALYGVDTHLANAAGWHRAFRDKGGNGGIIRRSVFSRWVNLTPGWIAGGVDREFEIYVLACAWPASRLMEAMDQPLRDAYSEKPILIHVKGEKIAFGSASCMVGYLGPNAMADKFWNPFQGLPDTSPKKKVGLFYLSSMSAVYLYDSAVRHGFYPVLFARQPIVPEAYLFDGMMRALIQGELEGGFVDTAAKEYAAYQKSIPVASARAMLFQ